MHGRAERYFERPHGVRNEALDARAYATAALHSLYMAGFKLAEHAARLKATASGKPASQAANQVYRSKFASG